MPSASWVTRTSSRMTSRRSSPSTCSCTQAKGELYLSALLDAADAHGLPVTLAPPKKTVEQVAALVGAAPGLLADRLTAMRKELGAPWTADHKAATAAALLALAQ